ncbi:sigma-54-dependent transcriptional regulator [Lacipirellula parvula]|uniref:DNA-binding transcriptional regulator NtrC n=1 Tax=Lacipirellula parvula TaxID=2650471 RepID=A0A5K7XHC1_9BACT|nr:sigma-54 dependent transcriptional regulator [Lacipirellula parvula]BBO35785.1 transcriptional regulator [Lacipirellula parvula]
MASLLVIDDDRTVLLLVKKAFADSDVEIHTASDAESGMAALREHKPDVLLLDILLPEVSGMELAREIRAIDLRLPVIFITATNDSDTAIEAMKMGAYDYLLKPLDIRQVRSLVERALETRRLMNSPVRLQEAETDSEDSDVLVGRSPKMLEVYKQIGRVAAQDVTVLIRGESGSGKELIARALYQHSHRNDQCFMAVNCAALTDTLLESELFGHEKGAFTGADRRHIGRFEQCNGGTIFLDEVGDMSPATQSKVLRLLQEQKFERVGGHDTISVDVRLISATNRDLEQMIEDNEFRLDLFHRLNGFEIQLPPLRERQGDLKLLLDHFLKRFNSQLSKGITSISPEALDLMEKYPWPGNIREMQGAVRRAMLMATGPTIVPELLPKDILEYLQPGSAPRRVAGASSSDDGGAVDLASFLDERINSGSENVYQESLQFMERYLLTRVLRETAGNQSKAALRLGITRGSLRNKMRELGIQVGQVVEGD